MKNTTYIYALINPFDNSVFYIGCSVNPLVRMAGHITDANTTALVGSIRENRLKLIREILVAGKEIEVIVLDDCELSEGTYWERFYIDLYRSYGFTLLQKDKSYNHTLVNSTNRLHSLPAGKSKYTSPPKHNTPSKIDGKDIHHYRREVFRLFKFYEHSNFQT